MNAILAFLFTELVFQRSMVYYYAEVKNFPAAGKSIVKMARIQTMITDTLETISDLEVLERM